jgi:outer membrane protein, multidrug efflux system
MAAFETKESAVLALKPSVVLSGILGVQGFQPAYLFQLPASMAYQLIGWNHESLVEPISLNR